MSLAGDTEVELWTSVRDASYFEAVLHEFVHEGDKCFISMNSM